MSFLFFDKEEFKNPIFEASMVKKAEPKKKTLKQSLSESFLKTLYSKDVMFEAFDGNRDFHSTIDKFVDEIRGNGNPQMNKVMIAAYKEAIKKEPEFSESINKNAVLKHATEKISNLDVADPLKDFVKDMLRFVLKNKGAGKVAILKEAVTELVEAIKYVPSQTPALKRFGTVLMDMVQNIDDVIVKLSNIKDETPATNYNIWNHMHNVQTSHITESIVLESILDTLI